MPATSGWHSGMKNDFKLPFQLPEDVKKIAIDGMFTVACHKLFVATACFYVARITFYTFINVAS